MLKNTWWVCEEIFFFLFDIFFFEVTVSSKSCSLLMMKKWAAAARGGGGDTWQEDLTSETVEGATLPLEGVDDIKGGDGLPLGVLGVGDGVADHVLQEDLEDGAGLLVDEARDTLDTTTAGEAANGGLGDALDVVAKNLAVPLGSTLSESLSTLSTARHCSSTCCCCC